MHASLVPDIPTIVLEKLSDSITVPRTENNTLSKPKVEASLPPDAFLTTTRSALWSSLAGTLIGLLASSGPYLGHNWVAWLAVVPLLGTMAAIVGTWLSLVTTDAHL